jgi:anti-sigma factor RsiW
MFEGDSAVAHRQRARKDAAVFGKKEGMTGKHVAETELALYVTGDVSLWRRVAVRLHLSGCAECRGYAEEFRADSIALRRGLSELPEGVNWERLSQEMGANIRVGLAAGECVAPHKKGSKRSLRLSWRPVAVMMAGAMVLLAGAWWLNVPAAQTRSLIGGIAKIWQRGGAATEDRGPTVEASERGIELRANGRALSVSGGETPVGVSASMKGLVRASYADGDTGQVTITAVYTQ